MSVCSPCFNSGIQVAYCNGGIAFGFVEPETNYTITVKSNATNKLQVFNAESDIDGLLTITGAKIDNGQGYTLELAGCNKFTICEVEYDCISFSVSNIEIISEEPEVINLMECVECNG
jgi:hypothetical protein